VKRNVWTEYTTRVADALLAGGNTYTPEGGLVLGTGHFDCVVITDGRFRNEVQNVRKQGGYVIKVESPVQTVRLNGHSSETELDSIPLSWFDAVLKNDKSHGLDALDWAVLEVLEQLGIQTQNHFATKSLSTNGVCIPNF
jgi:hypothetical protein